MCKLIKVPGKLPGSSIYLYNGYSYHFDKRGKEKRGKKKIYRCSTKSATKCRGILYHTKEGSIRVTKHNHKPEVEQLEKRRLIALMVKMTNETLKSTKAIFDEVCRQNETVGKYLLYPSLRSRLERVRAKQRPPLPKSLAELHEFLQEYKPLKKFYFGEVKAGDAYGLMFSTRRLLDALGKAVQLFMDGTFDVIPMTPQMMQLYSIRIRVMDTGVGTVFLLTEKRTASLYKAMWDKLFEIMPTLRDNIILIVSDYEHAAMSAARSKFPETRLQGCWFHYCQALLRRWKKLGLMKCPKGILWMAMSLALAPACKFAEGLNLMQLRAKKIAKKFPAIKTFFKYFNRTWIKKSHQVSVHDSAVRTNNLVESFHSTLKGKLGGVHPNLWVFLENLRDLSRDQEINLSRLDAGDRVSRPRSAEDISRDKKIKAMQKKLDSGSMPLTKFLTGFNQLHRKQAKIFDPEYDSD